MKKGGGEQEIHKRKELYGWAIKWKSGEENERTVSITGGGRMKDLDDRSRGCTVEKVP
jgi:hypothetical protein